MAAPRGPYGGGGARGAYPGGPGARGAYPGGAHYYGGGYYGGRYYGHGGYYYGPSFSFGFYGGFGYPYGYYGYPYGYYGYPYAYPYAGYPYAGYPYPGYGYATPPADVNVQPGVAYGEVRIEGAPKDAQVFADGNYVGVAEDFDGPVRHLILPAGSHQIEIRPSNGSRPIGFDVNVPVGRTVSVHADVR
jgi:hypothetical protein